MNSYGFRVLTDGIDVSRFEKNPIMLWNHSRTWAGREDEVLPIGRWENVRKEDGKLMADAVFDEKDDFSIRIRQKVEQGILNACSIGLRVVEQSDDPSVLVPGQTRCTVTRCVLLECSIVDIPSNQNACALYDDEGGIVELSTTGTVPVGLLTNKNNEMGKKELNLALGLAEDATEAEAVARAMELMTMETEFAKLKAEAEQARKTESAGLLDEALRSGQITLHGKAAFEKLFESDFDNAKKLLAELPERKPLVSGGETGTGMELANMSWDELDKAEKLQELKARDPEQYNQKFNEKFNKKK